ncbi:MAG TPA: hypothetical protein VF173_00105 [Thermoanaerobaculia bacterium]|nr:hypothetical protein [Thermoanaerobaculia bacterium]
MKKSPKLKLSRETLRNLGEPYLRKAAGAVSADCLTGQCLTAEVSCVPHPTENGCDSETC